MKKNKKIINSISTFVSVIFTILSLVIVGLVVYLNVLPTKYLILFLAVILLLLVVFTIILMRKKVRTIVKIIAIIICGGLMYGYYIGGVYIKDTYNFMNNVKTNDYITEEYYVMVKNDSNITSLDSIGGYSIEVYNEGTNLYEEALSKLTEVTNANIVEADSPEEMATSLIDGSISVIFISATYRDIIEETVLDFIPSTVVIYTIDVTVENKMAVETPEVDVMEEPFTIFISGVDTTGKISSRGRSDVNMLVTINPKTNQILLTSIPRDYYVDLYGKDAKDKLTHAGIYGVKTSIKTIEDLLDFDIDYYIKVNFSTLTGLIDAIGGVDVYSDISFTPKANTTLHIKKGINHMDGAMALAFARERYAYLTGDVHRVQNQQDVLEAIIKKVTASTVLITKYSNILETISSYFETNIDMDDLTKLVKYQMDEMPSWTIKKYNLNGTDSNSCAYSTGKQQVYVMIPTQSTVDEASYYINGMNSGKTFKDLGLE